jgi:hypothetical protein
MAHSITVNKQYGTDSEVNLNSSPNITSHTYETYDISLIFLNVAIVILPPYQIIGQIYILRQTLTINFSQENMRYLT